MSTTPTVANALAELAGWRADAEARKEKELSTLDEQVKDLEAEITTLESQLEALRDQVGILQEEKENFIGNDLSIRIEETQRGNASLLKTLEAQNKSLDERDGKVIAALKTRKSSMGDTIRAAGLAEVLDEYESFQEDTLQNIPQSYRDLLLKHRIAQEEQLAKVIDEAMSKPITLSEPNLSVDLVMACDTEDGPPIIHVLLPLRAEVHGDWAQRDEGAQTWIALRAVQGMYQFAKEAGQADARVVCGPYGDLKLLILELELDESYKGDPSSKMAEALTSSLKIGELNAINIDVAVNEVDIDLLMPLEDEGNA